MEIDGYTQPGASPNTNGPGLGSNATLKIELSGVNAVPTSGCPGDITNAGCPKGLRIGAGSSIVRGLVINRFVGRLIVIQTGGGNTIEGNYLNTDVNGNVGLGTFTSYGGIEIINSANNVIGGTDPQARNIISASANQSGLLVSQI